MRQKGLKILSWVFPAAGLISLIICIFNIIIGGLFAPAVDIQGGIGVAMVCTLAVLAISVLMVVIGLDMKKKFTAKTFKMQLFLVVLSVFTILFLFIGGYNVLPCIFGILLPAVTLFFIR